MRFDLPNDHCPNESQPFVMTTQSSEISVASFLYSLEVSELTVRHAASVPAAKHAKPMAQIDNEAVRRTAARLPQPTQLHT